MKGIAITAESIIVIVLAVLVLVAFIIFFGGSWGPSQQKTSLTAEQSRLCTRYTMFDDNCDDYASVDAKISGISTSLVGIGSQLGYATCTSGHTSYNVQNCIKDVCMSWCL